MIMFVLLTSYSSAENICWSSNMLSPTNVKPPWGYESKQKNRFFTLRVQSKVQFSCPRSHPSNTSLRKCFKSPW